MKPFQELIKNFERTRGYAREFLIYGFKSRQEMDRKSARTYDNERRRIEAILPEYVYSEMGARGKKVYLSMNPEGLEHNPLFALLETKSFTQNDVLLHYFLLDLLPPNQEMSLTDLVNALHAAYWESIDHVPFPDTMTVRNKLNQYVQLGLLTARKDGKQLVYKRHSSHLESLTPAESKQLQNALNFFTHVQPLGVIGHWINNLLQLSPVRDEDFGPSKDSSFCFKHLFLFHALDELLLYDILSAIRSETCLKIHYENTKKETLLYKEGFPLKISTSLWHGRRFVHFIEPKNRQHFTCRLDLIQSVTELPNKVQNERSVSYEDAYKNSWAITPLNKSGLDWLEMQIRIKDDSENYIIHRLEREGQFGQLSQLEDFLYLYRVEVTDLYEMIPWLRTWIGRIEKLESSNAKFLEGFYMDIDLMKRQYGILKEDC